MEELIKEPVPRTFWLKGQSVETNRKPSVRFIQRMILNIGTEEDNHPMEAKALM